MAKQPMWSERDEYRARSWRFAQHNATREYYGRWLPYYLVMAMAVPTAFAFAYLAIQVWAWTTNGHWYWNYALPPIAIIGVYMLLSVIAGKFSRPVDRY